MATLLEVFQTAFAHHQAGRLREAETLYRQILDSDPNNADALHLLGLVAHSRGEHAAAEDLITRAIARVSDRAPFHTNLGEVQRVQGKLDQAEQSLRRALALEPLAARAQNNLGIVLAGLGKLTEAIAAYRRAIDLQERFAEPHNNLGTVLQSSGETDRAIAHYLRAVEINPRYAAAYNNLGTAYKSQGLLDEAAKSYRQAVKLAPQIGDAQLNLGTVYQAEGRLAEAAECYREAVRLDPQSSLAHFNLGTLLLQQKRFDDAIAHFRQAVQLNPRDADAYNKLGIALKTQAIGAAIAEESRGVGHRPEASPAEFAGDEVSGDPGLIGINPDYAEAAEAFRQAIVCDPCHAPALVNLGNLLGGAGKYEEALKHHDRAVVANPKLGWAHYYRASSYKALHRHRDAIAGFQDALRLQPHNPKAYERLAVLYDYLRQPDLSIEYCRKGLDQDPQAGTLYANLATALGHQGRLAEAVEAARKAVALRPENWCEFSNLLYGLNRVPGYDPATLFEEHLEWARRHAEPFTVRAAAHNVDATPDRKLRVGYVSPHFREHAVNFFTEPLIAAHDHEQFDIFCYSDVKTPDGATRRLRAAADQWREVRYKSDKQLAEMVRADAIDILVDLTGHIGENRLLVFARKPAPVQVTYIGYQNTTGMSAMDYRLTDERADPPGETDQYYTERLVRLPRAFFCYRPASDVPEVTPLPVGESGRVTFGSFNNFDKVTQPTLLAWLEILKRVPNSRLLLLCYRGQYFERHIEKLAREHDLDPGRIELFPRRRRDQYYQLLQQADIALDPFPFNGHTTTCDAIWLGVPVVMLLGRMYASRFGSSVLANVGLDDLIAESVEQYVERAVGLAGDLDRLAELRAQLRPRMADSALLDYQGFARSVEAAYRQMWTTWCQQAND